MPRKYFRLLLAFGALLFGAYNIFANEGTPQILSKQDLFKIKSFYNNIKSAKSKNDREENDALGRWLWFHGDDFRRDGSMQPYHAYRPSETKFGEIPLGQSGWAPLGPVSRCKTYEPISCQSLGRVNCIAFHPTNPDIFWIGTPGGGVWKTVTGGKSWIPLGDAMPSMAVSSIAVDNNNPDILYVASGDYDGGGLSDNDAIGVLKSTDGGAHWQQTALAQQSGFSNSLLRGIVINKNNTKELIAGGCYGIWKTTDAGDSWNKVSDSLITDLEQDPVNPAIIYAACGRYSNYYGNPGVIKSTDFGSAWTDLNVGFKPLTEISRIELAVSPANPDYIYALAANSGSSNWSYAGGFHSFYLSTDAGKTWTQQININNHKNILGIYIGDDSDRGGQGSYDLTLLADPDDPNKVYSGGVNVWMSVNGGKNWEIASFWMYCFGESIHADHHAAGYNPLTKDIYFCNDGGVYRTKEIQAGSTDWIRDWVDRVEEDLKPGCPGFTFPTKWENLSSGLAITEFYRLGLSRNNPGYVSAGSQDNACYYNDTQDWTNYIANYDGMETMIDHNDPQIIYGVWQFGGLCRSLDGGKTISDNITKSVKNNNGENGDWVTPVAMDPTDPKVIYIGYRNLWRSTDRGDSWTKYLDFNKNATDTTNLDTLTIVKTSYNDSKYMSVYKRNTWIYNPQTKEYHSFPGELWITKDGSKSWNNSRAGLPLDSMNLSSIEYDAANPEIMWVSVSDWRPQFNLYYTDNGGESWKDVSRLMPEGAFVKSIVHQQGANNYIYAGTRHGVYVTMDGMTEWQPFNDNLPNAIIGELEIQPVSHTLYAATYGRGVWKSDLISSVAEPAGKEIAQPQIFPNPSKGEFSVDIPADLLPAGKAYISVLDIMGYPVYAEDIFLTGSNMKHKIAMDVPTGVYFVQISASGRNYVKKLNIAK